MITDIQYIVDNSGSKISVILPFAEWEKLNTEYQKLKNKLEIMTGIQKSMNEIRRAKKTGAKLQTLTDFIDES